MDTLSYKTISANDKIVKRSWYIIDAEDQVLGRMASKVAHVLRGKNKPYFTPHHDCGDYVIIINAEKAKLTGRKFFDKQYVHYTGYPGGQRFATPRLMFEKKPTFPVENAVRGMLPKNALGRKMLKKLFVYAGSEHPHASQKPKNLNL